jgi:hypothetical protein
LSEESEDDDSASLYTIVFSFFGLTTSFFSDGFDVSFSFSAYSSYFLANSFFLMFGLVLLLMFLLSFVLSFLMLLNVYYLNVLFEHLKFVF